jgi:hypothetical protein
MNVMSLAARERLAREESLRAWERDLARDLIFALRLALEALRDLVLESTGEVTREMSLLMRGRGKQDILMTRWGGNAVRLGKTLEIEGWSLEKD